MLKYNLSFICVNFNNSLYTEKLIESLRTQISFSETFSISCIIVDNSTDKGDSHNLEKYCSSINWVQYIRSPKNLGYFGGLNKGFEYTNKVNNDFVIICNNDLEFEKSFCQELCDQSLDENVFAICPDVITPEQRHQNPHVLKKIGEFRRIKYDLFFSHYYIACLLLFVKKFMPAKKHRYISTTCEIHMGIGACYILTKKFFSKFNHLDYPFFLYGEEAFFSHQIHSENGVLIYEPKLKVNHAESATLSKIPKRASYEFAREGYPRYRNLI